MTDFRHRFKIFIDFDGTVTDIDVGENMLLKFGDVEEVKQIIDRWIKGDIDSVTSWREMLATVPAYDAGKFTDFFNQINLRPGFHEFLKHCERSGHEVFIVSDGLDLYIKKILGNAGLHHMTVYSNSCSITPEGTIIPLFPYTDENCSKCANCKRNHILSHSSDEEITIYIGDGYSDLCAAQYCDFIFARQTLKRLCNINKISFSPFNDFFDILVKLAEMEGRKKIRKRHQAELRRAEAYKMG
ncbi:MAG: MtnX-like HAD-IB family phosphatase [Ignavibacteriales bacterium]|nr:MtnX-like HAD-IB family phosphatase [Ignavibacteriales bacterium]MCF8305274.1 MtnX-like HAD-IB family phosphatase [Ignavibacteriales bacterium]MCF8314813.1 MtnX-like HAD-IB family phosphatase [Ignavibacteriales bacterium]MCF8436238.1 MtnX-like HAD-IB family phosphatase [Ignavibacteriales bacterium]